MNIIIMIMSKNGVETVKSVVIVNIIKLLDRPWPSAETWCRLESPWGGGWIFLLANLVFQTKTSFSYSTRLISPSFIWLPHHHQSEVINHMVSVWRHKKERKHHIYHDEEFDEEEFANIDFTIENPKPWDQFEFLICWYKLL